MRAFGRIPRPQLSLFVPLVGRGALDGRLSRTTAADCGVQRAIRAQVCRALGVEPVAARLYEEAGDSVLRATPGRASAFRYRRGHCEIPNRSHMSDAGDGCVRQLLAQWRGFP